MARRFGHFAPPSRDAAVQLMLLRLLVAAAAMGAFNTAVALIYARLYNAGGGGVNGRITRGVYLVLFASSGVLHVFLVPQLEPGVIVNGAQELLPPLAVAVAHVLLPTAAAATFFLSMMLIYAHVGAGGGAVGDMMAIPTTTVKLLTKLWRKLFRPEEESKLKTKGGTDEANDDKIKTSKSRSGIVVMFAFPVYSCCRSSTGCV
uniref:Uncharacterized protein n=1 Tax=Oryza nivara TaxID=4536 RepID=A0A0E0HMA3_ORYNI